MKFSFAIVALLATTSAIIIREDPKPAADAKAVDAKAAADAAKPEKKADPANPGKALVDEATKSEEQKSDEAAAGAGKPIDTTGAPVAVDAPKKEEKPEPLSASEKMRNHILRIAATG